MSNLACGGVQRVGVWLAGGLHELGHHVSVLTFGGEGTDFFRLRDDIERVALGISRSAPPPLLQWVPSAFERLATLRRAIRATRPDVVISRAAQVNVPTLIATRGLAVPVIVTEHGDKPLRAGPQGRWPWNKCLHYSLRRLCYPSAHRVVSVSRGVDGHFDWLAPQRRAVVYNPMRPIEPRVLPSWPAGLAPDRPFLVSVGRLAHAKGYDILLDAFARVAPRHRAWQLAIVGDGELRAELERQAQTLGLGAAVVFAGALPEPFALMQRAALFVMASRFEGFPNAHGEALACALPVVATDCPARPNRRVPGGVRELVRHGVDGVLVAPEDRAALADALDRLMSDAARRREMAARAVEVTERFSPRRALAEWDGLLRSALAASPRPQLTM